MHLLPIAAVHRCTNQDYVFHRLVVHSDGYAMLHTRHSCKKRSYTDCPESQWVSSVIMGILGHCGGHTIEAEASLCEVT